MENISSKSAPRLNVLGVQLHSVRMAEALASLRSYLAEPGFHLVVTLGTEMVMRAQTDREFLELVNGADLVVPDGVGLVWASRYCGHPAYKVAGIELVGRLIQEVPEARLFLLGGAPGVAQEAAEAMRKARPDVQIVGIQDGFFKDDEAVVATIAASGANVLLAGLGSPRQELWMARHGSRLGVAVGIGVGGTFDVLSGRLHRAPRWMINMGLEWLYRLLRQPSRWNRMLALPRFALKVLRTGRRAVLEAPF